MVGPPSDLKDQVAAFFFFTMKGESVMGAYLRDLPVFILLAAFLGFFAYVFIKSRKHNQDEKDQKKK